MYGYSLIELHILKKKLRKRFKNIQKPQRAANLGLNIIRKAKTRETESEAGQSVEEAANSAWTRL